jgi:hypothetical protein
VCHAIGALTAGHGDHRPLYAAVVVFSYLGPGDPDAQLGAEAFRRGAQLEEEQAFTV